MSELFFNFINLFFTALWLAILGRVIMSWVGVMGANNPVIDTINQLLLQITEPILSPIRRLIPPLGMFDLTPMIALILISVIRQVLVASLVA